MAEAELGLFETAGLRRAEAASAAQAGILPAFSQIALMTADDTSAVPARVRAWA